MRRRGSDRTQRAGAATAAPCVRSVVFFFFCGRNRGAERTLLLRKSLEIQSYFLPLPFPLALALVFFLPLLGVAVAAVASDSVPETSENGLTFSSSTLRVFTFSCSSSASSPALVGVIRPAPGEGLAAGWLRRL
ncbi:hypothetical protein GQ54DRAFT_100140 [Martensiomyces pterosporus]|nr:hypothetical protein GQ54DRAFT_100140 [Martensiomyces pterosporus]